MVGLMRVSWLSEIGRSLASSELPSFRHPASRAACPILRITRRGGDLATIASAAFPALSPGRTPSARRGQLGTEHRRTATLRPAYRVRGRLGGLRYRGGLPARVPARALAN